jgi:hypothetical protein
VTEGSGQQAAGSKKDFALRISKCFDFYDLNELPNQLIDYSVHQGFDRDKHLELRDMGVIN